MKSKKVLAILLSMAIMLTFMPTMAFAAGTEGATDADVVVTTTDGTLGYPAEEFTTALEDVNDATNMQKNASVKLNADVALTANVDVKIPLTINKNGHSITYSAGSGGTKYALTPAKTIGGTTLAVKAICRGESGDVISFAKHEQNVVLNWEEDATKGTAKERWTVVSRTVTCPNCGETTEEIPNPSITYDDTNSEKYIWSCTDKETGAIDKRELAKEVYRYTIKSDAVIERINNKTNKHNEDGTPVVKAVLTDTTNNADVDAKVAITAVSNADLAKVQNLTIYKEDGTTITDESAKSANVAATCATMGAKVYKAVVSDPDDKVLDTRYLIDSQAAPVTEHQKGAFKGIELVVKSNTAYNSVSEAAAAASANNIEVFDIKENANGKYEYWSWSGNVISPAECTRTHNTEWVITQTQVEAAADKDGKFTYREVYFCNTDYKHSPGSPEVLIKGEAVPVAPLAAAETKAQLQDNYSPTGSTKTEKYYKYSKCTTYEYAPDIVEYSFNEEGKTTQTEHRSIVGFAGIPKVKTTHKGANASGGGTTVDPTCKSDGYRTVKCDICESDGVKVVIPATGSHTFGEYTGAIGANNIVEVDAGVSGTLSTDKKTATVAATCVADGGTYHWCTSAGGHWVLDKDTVVKATGHTLSNIVTEGNWAKSDGLEDEANAKYEGTVKCATCNADCTVVFNSKAGEDKSYGNHITKYSAITVDPKEKGEDCKTDPKTTYTVKGMQNTAGKYITKSVANGGPKGDHVFEATSWNWKADYKSATVTGKCSVCEKTNLSETATVTQATDATGLTTFTAKFGDKTDVKTGYALADAEITFDAEKLTDGNLIVVQNEENAGYAANPPEVTVKINGTIIDPSSYTTTWTYSDKVAKPTVKWSDAILASEKVIGANSKTPEKGVNVAMKSLFDLSAELYYDEVKINDFNLGSTFTRDYSSSKAVTISVKDAKDAATVKYAVLNEPVAETKTARKQQNIDAVDYNLDSVSIKDAGTYYVYAQAKADGYTTVSKLVATVKITRTGVNVMIDNATSREGEMPELNVQVYDIAQKQPVTFDKSEFTITTVGGQELDKLLPGNYDLMVTAKNYKVTLEGNPKLTVLTKDGKTPEEEAKAAAEAADKALASANAAAAKSSDYTADSYGAVKKAADELKALLAKKPAASTAEIKAATEKLNKAVKGLVAKKANPMKVKVKKVKAKAKKKVSKKAITVTGAQGAVTYKKVKGNKKIKVNAKTGKITVKKGLKKKKTYKVKVKITAAGNGNYKAASVTKTIKVKVK